MNAIRHVRPGNNFEPSFRVFGRSDVNGANRLELYSWALGLCDSPTPTYFDPKMLYYDPISMEDVRWNFEKVSLRFLGSFQTLMSRSSSTDKVNPTEDTLLLLDPLWWRTTLEL